MLRFFAHMNPSWKDPHLGATYVEAICYATLPTVCSQKKWVHRITTIFYGKSRTFRMVMNDIVNPWEWLKLHNHSCCLICLDLFYYLPIQFDFTVSCILPSFYMDVDSKLNYVILTSPSWKPPPSFLYIYFLCPPLTNIIERLS